MSLRAKKPEVKEKRLKLFVYGPAGIGKTMAAIQFPNAVIVDTERGTDFYSKTIVKNNSVVLQTVNPDEVRDELRELLTTKHDYRTLIIDPITQIYNSVQEKWTKIFEKHSKSQKDAEIQDFGMRYWSKVKSEFKALQRIILSLDMNVIVTSHQKDVYGAGFNKVGVTYDSMKGDSYIFDLVFRLVKKGDKRLAITEKERGEIGEQKFPAEFEWTYLNFLNFYGQDIIEREAKVVDMATKQDVAKLNKLIEVVKVDDDTIQKWLHKANADGFDELTKGQITKCINFVEKKLKDLKGEK